MIVFEAHTYLAIATVVWLLWRVAVWRRSPRDPMREIALAGLLLWSLVVVRLTFFPLKIVLYDWHASINVVPFASMFQLVSETNPTVAFDNIVGNIVLFVPFGLLLPLLFVQLRTPWSLLWRIAVMSGTIETAQLLTRARSTDVDDVILNTFGAALGFAIFTLTAPRLGRLDEPRAIVDRLGLGNGTEPLLSGWVPIAATGAIVLPMMFSVVVGATISDGPGGILGYSLEDSPTGQVAGRAETSGHTFVAISDGPSNAERVVLFDFEEVLPGRFTWVGTSEMPEGDGSRYSWTMTAFNTVHDAGPVVAVWGTNRSGADTILITGNGASERLKLEPGGHFVVAFLLDDDDEVTTLEDFSISFLDAQGSDVSQLFELVGR